MLARRSEERIDRLPRALGEDFEGLHRRSRLPGLDQGDGLAGQVGAGHLGHRETRLEPRTTNVGRIDFYPGKPPAWHGPTLSDGGGIYITLAFQLPLSSDVAEPTRLDQIA